MTLLDNLILIHTIDGKPLNNRFISQVVPATLCIQDHSKYKSFGIVNMNFNVILGIDWLQKHNPSINCVPIHILFSHCGMNLVDLNSWDLRFLHLPLDLDLVQNDSIAIKS